MESIKEQDNITTSETTETAEVTPTLDLSSIDRVSLLAEIESIQVEIKERQDQIVFKAKLLEQAVEYVGKEKVESLKNKDISEFTNEEWDWLMSEGQIDDRSGTKHEFKKSILFGKFGFLVEKFWKFTNQSCLTISKIFFKVPDYNIVDRIKDISNHYKTLNSFHDQESVHIFQIQDKQQGKAGVYYLEFNPSNNTGRITKVYHNATTEPKTWEPIEDMLKHVEKIAV